MGMKDEFAKAREWVANNLDMSTMVSSFAEPEPHHYIFRSRTGTRIRSKILLWISRRIGIGAGTESIFLPGAGVA
jgi:hypothetical protein